MPRTPIDYSKTVFYKIACNDLSIKDCYVGHTTDFTKRKSVHKSRCVCESQPMYHLTVYTFIREFGGWENWSVVPIEEHNCSSMVEGGPGLPGRCIGPQFYSGARAAER